MNIKSTKIINAARELLKLYGYFVDNLWHIDDIHFICEQRGLQRLRNDEAMQVFIIANEQFDGESGISWPKLESALMTYLKQKDITEALTQEVDQ